VQLRFAKRASALISGLAVGVATVGFATLTPAAADAPPRTVVSETPAANTPNVLDGAVRAVGQIGDTVYLGGNFTQVAQPGSTNGSSRPFLVAFDAATGQLRGGFTPALDGLVNAIVPAPDGQSIYVGGNFNNVAGSPSKSVARLDATTGQPVAGFSTVPMNGLVWSMDLAGDRLIIGGNFTRVGENDRVALASLDAGTGGFDPYVDVNIAGNHNGGATTVRSLAVRPDEAQLVVGGNFRTVSGQTRRQVALIDLGASASLSTWATDRFSPECSRSFNTHIRDIDYSSDGGYFVVVTTGAGFQDTMCDAASRWESNATGSGQQPSWVSYSGGDTITAVDVTDSVVYIGGHFRWMNNPFGRDTARAGAVEREGLAALDARNGVPLRWDPGRVRGYGVWDFLTTSTGLYIGSDTSWINGHQRMRIGRMPHDGGTSLPADEIGGLPNDVIQIRSALLSHTATAIPFDGTTAGSPTTIDSGSHWSNARAATMIDDTLYVARSNGTLTAQDFDGETFGQPRSVPLNSIPDFASDLSMMTGMFFDPELGRLYFTRSGSTSLFYRYFTPESEITDPRRFTAGGSVSGFIPASVSGMFLADGTLYAAQAPSGALTAIDWVDGRVSGTGSIVNNQRDWRGRLFLRPGGGPVVEPNEPPEAAFSFECEELSCTFDASASEDPDGEIVEFEWEFGDNTTGSGETTQHEYSASGSYDVTLTVTDDEGDTDEVTHTVTVTDGDVGELAHRATASANGNGTSRSVTVPADVEAGDGMLLFVNQNSGGAAVSEPDGWTQVEVHDAGGFVTTLYQRQATGDDAGSSVTVTSSIIQKIDMVLVAYAGTGAEPIADYAVVTEDKFLTEHTSPQVSGNPPGSWAVTHFVDKSSSTTSWTASGAVAVRSESIGAGGGRMTSLTVDSDAAVGSTYGGVEAETDAPSSSSAVWTVVLAPS
jgi:PKD repeat protein